MARRWQRALIFQVGSEIPWLSVSVAMTRFVEHNFANRFAEVSRRPCHIDNSIGESSRLRIPLDLDAIIKNDCVDFITTAQREQRLFPDVPNRRRHEELAFIRGA